MVIDEIRRGVRLAAVGVQFNEDIVELLSDAISKQAIYDLEGRHAFALDEDG